MKWEMMETLTKKNTHQVNEQLKIHKNTFLKLLALPSLVCSNPPTVNSRQTADRLQTEHQGYTTAVTFPHHPHPLSHFYTNHCRPISSVDMTREKSEGQSTERQKSVSTQRATLGCVE